VRTVGLIVGLRVGVFVGFTVKGKAVGLKVGLLDVVPGVIVGSFFNGKRRRYWGKFDVFQWNKQEGRYQCLQ
jgi:hypothetical protein